MYVSTVGNSVDHFIPSGREQSFAHKHTINWRNCITFQLLHNQNNCSENKQQHIYCIESVVWYCDCVCVCVCRWRTEAQRPPGASSTGSTGASTWGPSSPWEAWPTSSRTSALSWATSSPPPASASPSWCSCWAVPSSSPSPRTAAPSQRCSRSWASPVAPPGYPRSPACYGEEGRKGETVGGVHGLYLFRGQNDCSDVREKTSTDQKGNTTRKPLTSQVLTINNDLEVRHAGSLYNKSATTVFLIFEVDFCGIRPIQQPAQVLTVDLYVKVSFDPSVGYFSIPPTGLGLHHHPL